MSKGKHSTYTIVLRWSEPEQVYRAEVPAIPGCEGTGSTYEAACSARTYEQPKHTSQPAGETALTFPLTPGSFPLAPRRVRTPCQCSLAPPEKQREQED